MHRVYAITSNPISEYICLALARLPQQPAVPELVLLLRNNTILTSYLQNDSSLTVNLPRNKSISSQFMAAVSPPKYEDGSYAHMSNMLIGQTSTKEIAFQLDKYRACIRSDSNILLLDPNWTTLELVSNHQLWNKNRGSAVSLSDGEDENPSKNLLNFPSVWIGSTKFWQRAQFHKIKPFTSSLNTNSLKVADELRPLSLKLCKFTEDVSNRNKIFSSKNEDNLITLLKETSITTNQPLIDTTFISYNEYLISRLQELIIDSCLISISKLFGCNKYKELRNVENFHRLINLILKEQFKIIRCAFPELFRVDIANLYLNEIRLNKLIFEKVNGNGSITNNQLNNDKNISNKWFIYWGIKYNKSHYWNYMLWYLLKGKITLYKNSLTLLSR
ncbi:hypothetical protein TBLA_0H03260 [Henningerozyma blattae CBS 6284]|uniref:Uncharacterized protein n=1 Tax=Henningerozyma blattae (strain ATCC 34711 / CBS 6284 / DSM 70876 / NBRC 10599 / NRRL Y-10934 / UCD 77-7) TaxID=1071380 RepID=I2H8A5_HENB6|nr:hypothetical protein TBLA_0H03260 [Tetrapisispora blattae CBS 6284]CCH62607.1 hypothetical protein TBLA_0H03260 [Tetrapisispora blattae CBS 6284]